MRTEENHKQFIGQNVGQCKILEFYAKEITGFVFKGYHAELKKEMIVKILFSSLAMDYFVSRVKKIATLEHSKISKIYEVGMLADKYYIIEEPCFDGASMKEVL